MKPVTTIAKCRNRKCPVGKRSFDGRKNRINTLPYQPSYLTMKLLPVLAFLAVSPLAVAQDTANPNASSTGLPIQPALERLLKLEAKQNA